MVTAVVVVVDEVGNCPLKLAREFIRDLVHFPLDALVVAFQLAVSLGMEGCRQDMADAHQMQIVPEGPGDVASAVIREQSGAVLDRYIGHAGGVYRCLEDSKIALVLIDGGVIFEEVVPY